MYVLPRAHCLHVIHQALSDVCRASQIASDACLPAFVPVFFGLLIPPTPPLLVSLDRASSLSVPYKTLPVSSLEDRPSLPVP